MRPAVAIAIFAALPLSVAFADVYRSVDAQGHVLYSDTPTPGAELVRIGNSSQRANSTASASSTPARTAAPPPPKVNDPSKDQLSRQAAARTVQSDVAQTRADQCKKLTEAYQQAVAARRIYNADANGERIYLTDEQADAQRVNAKLAMDEACGNQ
jgi:hypothetical protein